MPFGGPRLHFYHPHCWINDPNGLVYANGVYHLFYQLNPDDTVWGNIHWGHATSEDALNWKIEEPALAPDSVRGLPFSGTALENSVDTSPRELRGLLALFTRSFQLAEGAREEQYLARFDYESKTFRSVLPDPVIKNPDLSDFRDPKLWRRGHTWHAVVACRDHLRFYRSEDLITWQETSIFTAEVGYVGGIWECPDLLSFVTADGSSVDILVVSIGQHEVTTAANVGYFVGTFDGEAFHPDPDIPYRPFDYGPDFYALQSWSGVAPESPLAIGWMGNWAYAHRASADGYGGCLSLPRVLDLTHSNGRWVLRQKPISGITALFQDAVDPQVSSEGRSEWSVPAGRAFVLRGSVVIDSGSEVRIAIGDVKGRVSLLSVARVDTVLRITLDRGALWETETEEARVTQIVIDSPSDSAATTVALYVDTCSIEAFFDGGEIAATQLVPWEEGQRTVVTTGPPGCKGGVDWKVLLLRPVSIR